MLLNRLVHPIIVVDDIAKPSSLTYSITTQAQSCHVTHWLNVMLIKKAEVSDLYNLISFEDIYIN